MIRRGVVVGLLALCCFCPAASAGSEIYYLVGAGARGLGDDVQKLADATAAGLASQPLLGGSWSAKNMRRAGFDGGLGFSYAPGALLGVCAEVHGVSRGDRWSVTEPDSGFEITQSLALNYIEVPLLLRIAPRLGGSTRPSLQLGPFMGFRIHSKTNSSLAFALPQDASASLLAVREAQGLQALSYLETTNVSGDAKATYLGGVIAVGLRFRTSQTTALLVQARYLKGFTNVLEDRAGYDLKPQDFTFSLGTSFAL